MGWSGRPRDPFPVHPVVAPFGPQLGRERERLARLLHAAELHQRAPEAEQREVVRRSALDHRLELLTGLLELLRAEVRTAQRLTDRGLLGIQVAGLLQR